MESGTPPKTAAVGTATCRRPMPRSCVLRQVQGSELLQAWPLAMVQTRVSQALP